MPITRFRRVGGVAIVKGQAIPFCAVCDEYPSERTCVRCGKLVCEGRKCSARCASCHLLKRQDWYCWDCAGVHEITRKMTGGCEAEWKSGATDFLGMQQRRREFYKKKGWV